MKKKEEIEGEEQEGKTTYGYSKIPVKSGNWPMAGKVVRWAWEQQAERSRGGAGTA